MQFIPKKYKHQKHHKGNTVNRIKNFPNTLKTSIFATNMISLRTISSGTINSKQLNSFFRCAKKYVKKLGRFKLFTFPHTPKTKKPVEVRMGKGKGSVSFWVARLKIGTVLCQIDTKFNDLAIKALIQAKLRIPIKTTIKLNNDN